MADGEKKDGQAQERPGKGEAGAGGNSLQDASEDAVRFMEGGDEPGHAGRGDGG